MLQQLEDDDVSDDRSNHNERNNSNDNDVDNNVRSALSLAALSVSSLAASDGALDSLRGSLSELGIYFEGSDGGNDESDNDTFERDSEGRLRLSAIGSMPLLSPFDDEESDHDGERSHSSDKRSEHSDASRLPPPLTTTSALDNDGGKQSQPRPSEYGASHDSDNMTVAAVANHSSATLSKHRGLNASDGSSTIDKAGAAATDQSDSVPDDAGAPDVDLLPADTHNESNALLTADEQNESVVAATLTALARNSSSSLPLTTTAAAAADIDITAQYNNDDSVPTDDGAAPLLLLQLSPDAETQSSTTSKRCSISSTSFVDAIAAKAESDHVTLLLASPTHTPTSYRVRDVFPNVYEPPIGVATAAAAATHANKKAHEHRSPTHPIATTATAAPKKQQTQSMQKRLDAAQSRRQIANQCTQALERAQTEKRALQQRNARLRQQLETLTSDLLRTKAAHATLRTEHDLLSAKLPQLQRALLDEATVADDRQAQAVQQQLVLAQLRARVQVLQTRFDTNETERESLQHTLRDCRRELHRKASALAAATDKLPKVEAERHTERSAHAQAKQHWRAQLTGMKQRFEHERLTLVRDAQKEQAHALQEAKAQATKAIKRCREQDALCASLERDLALRQRECDASKRDAHTHAARTQALERQLQQTQRTATQLRRDYSACAVELRAIKKAHIRDLKYRQTSNQRTTRERKRTSMSSDVLLLPLDELLLEVAAVDSHTSDSEPSPHSHGYRHHCACCIANAIASTNSSPAQSTPTPLSTDSDKHHMCGNCEDVRAQLQLARNELERLRNLHAYELKTQTAAFAHMLQFASPTLRVHPAGSDGSGVGMSA